MSIDKTTNRRLTPCAGRCSTVFGDQVCRGCRRYSHEVIHWNGYEQSQQQLIWRRLDAQLDQILLPMIPQADFAKISRFLHSKQIELLADASSGRQLYAALKFCEKKPEFVESSGLEIEPDQLKPLWDCFEKRIYTLANAHFDLEWLRANAFSHQR